MVVGVSIPAVVTWMAYRRRFTPSYTPVELSGLPALRRRRLDLLFPLLYLVDRARQVEKVAGHVSPKRVYYTIFASLMVLTAITVSVAFIPLGRLNFPVALSIAILKATLVLLFFMHVKYSSRLTKLVCGTAFFLLVLFGLTLSDYLSRGCIRRPEGRPARARGSKSVPQRRHSASAEQDTRTFDKACRLVG